MSEARLSRGALVALVVGSMVGAGIFTAAAPVHWAPSWPGALPAAAC
jgi:hypothetical protein